MARKLLIIDRAIDAPREGDGFDFGLEVVRNGLAASLPPRTP